MAFDWLINIPTLMRSFPSSTDDAVRPGAASKLRLLSPKAWLDRSAGGRIFVEGIVDSIFVVVVHVIADQPTEMCFVQRDDVVEDLSPATSHPSFRSAILPRHLSARSFGLRSSGLQEGDHFLVTCQISIEDGISIRTRFGESLAAVVDHPLRCRVVSHVEVQNPAPPVLDHEKAVE
jgi:hypothetical protein